MQTNLCMIIDLNIKAENIKLLEKNKEEYLCYMLVSNVFKVTENNKRKRKISSLDFTKIKNFWSSDSPLTKQIHYL